MSDYIKREDAFQAVADNNYSEDITLKGYDRIIDAIYDIPSADVVEVRHGEWIYGESEEGHDGYRCSECGEFIPWEYDEYDIDFIKEVHYCPNCGAKMDDKEYEQEIINARKGEE